MKSTVFVSALMLGVTASTGCGPPVGRRSEDLPHAAATSLPQPGAEMRKLLNAFVGTWSITEEYAPTPSMPNGGVGHGEQVWRPGPGGLSVIEEYRSETPGGEVVGMSVSWWDAQAQRYQTIWCANVVPAGCVTPSDGLRWMRDQLVYLDERETNGKKSVFKEVYSDLTPSSFTQTIEVGESGGDLKPVVTLQARKVSRGPER